MQFSFHWPKICPQTWPAGGRGFGKWIWWMELANWLTCMRCVRLGCQVIKFWIVALICSLSYPSPSLNYNVLRTLKSMLSSPSNFDVPINTPISTIWLFSSLNFQVIVTRDSHHNNVFPHTDTHAASAGRLLGSWICCHLPVNILSVTYLCKGH